MGDDRSLEEVMHGKGDLKKDELKEKKVGPCASRVTAPYWPGFHALDATIIGEKRKTTRSFDYSHMGYREFDASGTFFIIEINEPEKWRIRADGRALWEIFNDLHRHKLEWIKAIVGNEALGVPDGTPVIDQLTIQRIEDEPKKP